MTKDQSTHSGTYDPQRPVSLAKSLGVLRRGLGDPTIRLSPTEVWFALGTPTGDASLRICKASLNDPAIFQAWGPGAEWAVRYAPDLLGAGDNWSEFDAPEFAAGLPEIVQHTRSLHRDVILPRTNRIFDHLLGAVLEQRVTGIEANYAWRWLIRHKGRPAPGPAPDGLRIAPGASQIATMTRWEWQEARVDQQRARTLRQLAPVARSLEWWAEKPMETSKPGAQPPGTLQAALLSLPGIGAWTVAETLQRSHGATDLISVGDFHLAGFVGQVLTGRRVDDSGMLQLLAPFAPHRQRVIRLLQLSGERKQSFGPRYAPLDHRER
ncbi:DNA-3-methyladenine glycosylase family protein [Glutamicibacter sp. NPDC087344]|uniref:DNA-3-methyladenine glycosylase family protein n=1 Tax=Glutamicibacter sp. NPDC087344 TaxID=3363994 RepID=UPI0037F2AC92